MSDAEDEDEDAAFAERWRRRQARYADAGVTAPVPMWWPWPLERVVIEDGDPDTGLIVVGLEPFLWPGETSHDAGRPYAKLVRRPRGEPPYRYGWPGLAGQPVDGSADEDEPPWEEEPPGPVFAHSWQEGRWEWTVFIDGVRELTPAELARIREKLDRDHHLPQGRTSYRPWG